MDIKEWEKLLQSGSITHVRPRKHCGVWQLHAYNRNLEIPLVGSIEDSPEAYKAVISAGISMEDILT